MIESQISTSRMQLRNLIACTFQLRPPIRTHQMLILHCTQILPAHEKNTSRQSSISLALLLLLSSALIYYVQRVSLV